MLHRVSSGGVEVRNWPSVSPTHCSWLGLVQMSMQSSTYLTDGVSLAVMKNELWQLWASNRLQEMFLWILHGWLVSQPAEGLWCFTGYGMAHRKSSTSWPIRTDWHEAKGSLEDTVAQTSPFSLFCPGTGHVYKMPNGKSVMLIFPGILYNRAAKPLMTLDPPVFQLSTDIIVLSGISEREVGKNGAHPKQT